MWIVFQLTKLKHYVPTRSSEMGEGALDCETRNFSNFPFWNKERFTFKWHKNHTPYKYNWTCDYFFTCSVFLVRVGLLSFALRLAN